MSSGAFVTIICAIIGASGLFGFLQFMISRRDNKKDNKEDRDKEFKNAIKEMKDTLTEFGKKLDKIERDSVRGQLLTLIANYPDDVHEIMKCAEYYFIELEGNWFTTPIFANYLKEHEIAEPEWLFNANSSK